MKSYLKTVAKHHRTIIDDNGVVLDEQSNTIKVLAGRDEFWLMYSSMVLILKASKDVNIKLFASLLERYASGVEFSMGRGLKDIIAKECGCSSRSLDNSLCYLVNKDVVVRLSNNLYKINPRHVFQGSSNTRNQALKAIIELGCKDC